MPQINRIIKQTDNKYLNLYLLEAQSKTGREVRYNVASRAREVDAMKLRTRINREDGVAVYAVYGKERDRVVLVRQYRYSIDDYIYEMPAGLCEEGEDYHVAAIREMHEETGLRFTPIKADPLFEAPRFTSVGMSDESVTTVFGYAEGEVSTRFQEDAEEIRVVLADREEVRRILREEKVAMQCAYQMMHFLHDRDVFGFLG
ncbi:MAG: NUDIX hydrolase [Lachnospiraceae bacterium]|nr:NUDIX hydrolase [Lachnospiraceae bacterium]